MMRLDSALMVFAYRLSVLKEVKYNLLLRNHISPALLTLKTTLVSFPHAISLSIANLFITLWINRNSLKISWALVMLLDRLILEQMLPLFSIIPTYRILQLLSATAPQVLVQAHIYSTVITIGFKMFHFSGLILSKVMVILHSIRHTLDSLIPLKLSTCHTFSTLN